MGMTQEALSKLSGVSKTSISKIERGAVRPYWRTLWRLADALDTFDCKGPWIC
jgi:transcriptional regulator with XRE-family HTH domain